MNQVITAETRAKIKAMWNEGHKMTEIARALRVSTTTVHRYKGQSIPRKKLNPRAVAETRRTIESRERKFQAAALFEDGWDYRAIAQRMGLDECTIHRYLRGQRDVVTPSKPPTSTRGAVRSPNGPGPFGKSSKDLANHVLNESVNLRETPRAFRASLAEIPIRRLIDPQTLEENLWTQVIIQSVYDIGRGGPDDSFHAWHQGDMDIILGAFAVEPECVQEILERVHLWDKVDC